jgi:hypothetical protein
MKFGAKKNPTVQAGGSRFAPSFIQNLYTVLKKRLWESRSTPTLGCPFIRHILFIRIMNIFDLLFEYSNNIRIFIRTYAEEENCKAIFRRSGSEFIILQIPKTENLRFQKQKICGFGFRRLQETTLFFQ